jgi:hypothetical protein
LLDHFTLERKFLTDDVDVLFLEVQAFFHFGKFTSHTLCDALVDVVDFDNGNDASRFTGPHQRGVGFLEVLLMRRQGSNHCRARIATDGIAKKPSENRFTIGNDSLSSGRGRRNRRRSRLFVEFLANLFEEGVLFLDELIDDTSESQEGFVDLSRFLDVILVTTAFRTGKIDKIDTTSLFGDLRRTTNKLWFHFGFLSDGELEDGVRAGGLLVDSRGASTTHGLTTLEKRTDILPVIDLILCDSFDERTALRIETDFGLLHDSARVFGIFAAAKSRIEQVADFFHVDFNEDDVDLVTYFTFS